MLRYACGFVAHRFDRSAPFLPKNGKQGLRETSKPVAHTMASTCVLNFIRRENAVRGGLGTVTASFTWPAKDKPAYHLGFGLCTAALVVVCLITLGLSLTIGRKRIAIARRVKAERDADGRGEGPQ
jgi:hypothetical protein